MKPWTTIAVMVVALLLTGCGDQRHGPEIGEEPAGGMSPPQPEEPGEANVVPTPPRPDEPGEQGALPAQSPETLEVVPVLSVHGDLDDSGGLELRSLVWNAVLRSDLATFQTAIAATPGQGTATLTGRGGQVLAESPAEVMQDSLGGTSVSAFLVVPDHAEEAHRLQIHLDDGRRLTVDRDSDVSLVHTDVPEPGPLQPDARISWEASSGTVEGRWLAGSHNLDGAGDPAVYGRSGVAEIGGASLPPDGGWLLLVAFDGLAFDIEVAGPYLHPDGGGSPVDWRVFFEGEDIGEVGTVEISTSDSPWHAQVDVWVLPPGGGDVHPDDIAASWSSDRQGDLHEFNLQSAPTLWLNTDELLVGEHVWTLRLEAELPGGDLATHQERIEVLVVEPNP